MEYRVKWSGYRTQTWEPAMRLEEDAPEVIEDYEASLSNNRSNGRMTRRNTALLNQQLERQTEYDSDDERAETSSEAVLFAAARCL